MEITRYIDFAPRFSGKDAEFISRELYGMDVFVQPLPSERDQNFLLKDKKSGNKYVLKISNQKEKKEILELQNSAMERIGLFLNTSSCPQICLTARGKKTEKIRNKNRESHFVRLVTYIEGVPLAEVRPHSPGLLRSIGRFIAKIDQVLKEFSHPAAKRDFYWDLQKGPEVIKNFISYINDPDELDLINYFLNKFHSQASPIISELGKTIIHNDGNDYNILISHPDKKGSNQKKAYGIIDFGDMVYSYTMGDIAVAASYVMMGKKNFWESASYLIKGYNEIIKISDKELEAIHHFIYLRLCMSVALSAFQKKQYPDNEYLSISEKKAWELLKRIREVKINPAHFV